MSADDAPTFTGPGDAATLPGGLPRPDAATAPPAEAVAKEQAIEAEALADVPREPGAPKPDPILVADGVTRRFGGVTAVNVDHVEFQRGAISALIGPNGAGKTTFFNLLTNFDKATAGSWTFNGKKLAGVAPHKVARLGMIRTFQLTKSLSKLSVIQNMMLGATHQRGESFLTAIIPPLWSAQEREITERADALLERFRLAHMREEFAGSLSGGQRKLLEMARALMAEPKLLLLDEPLSSLDKKTRLELQAELMEMQKLWKIPFVLVTHDPEEAETMGGQVLFLEQGRQVAAKR